MAYQGYFIRRLESDDPCSPLQFWPAKDSDELYEALKAAFPHVKTHKERMRDAVIEFHMSERNQERANSAASVGTPISATPSQAPTFSLQESFGSSASPEYLPSPESINSSSFTTPQSSADASRTPSMQQMTSVWCLPNKPQARTRTRRTMTEEEKLKYAQKRITGACADCKRRRRKCNHDIISASERTSSGCRKSRSSPKKKAVAATPEVSKVAPAAAVSTTAPPAMMAVDGAAIALNTAASPPFSQPFDFSNDFDLFPSEDVFGTSELDSMSMLPEAFDFFPQQHQYQVSDWASQQFWQAGYSQQQPNGCIQAPQQYVSLAEIHSPRYAEHSTGLQGTQPFVSPGLQEFVEDHSRVVTTPASRATSPSSTASLLSHAADATASNHGIHSATSLDGSALRSSRTNAVLAPTHTIHTHEGQQPELYSCPVASGGITLEIGGDLLPPDRLNQCGHLRRPAENVVTYEKCLGCCLGGSAEFDADVRNKPLHGGLRRSERIKNATSQNVISPDDIDARQTRTNAILLDAKDSCIHGRTPSRVRAEREHSSPLAKHFYSTPESVSSPIVVGGFTASASNSATNSPPRQSSVIGNQASESGILISEAFRTTLSTPMPFTGQSIQTAPGSQWTKFLRSQYVSDANAAAMGLDIPLDDPIAASFEDPSARIELRIRDTFRKSKRDRLLQQSLPSQNGACVDTGIARNHFVQSDVFFLQSLKDTRFDSVATATMDRSLLEDLQPDYHRQRQDEDSLQQQQNIAYFCWTQISSTLVFLAVMVLTITLQHISPLEITVQHLFSCFIALLQTVPAGMALQKGAKSSRGRTI